MDYRTPFARARGLGAAHHGSSHWWWQRITALVLLPLAFWFLLCLARLPDADYLTIRAWLQNPVNSALGLIFMLSALYHSALGLQVVMEDYLHTRWLKFSAITFTHALMATAGLAGTFAMLSLLFSP